MWLFKILLTLILVISTTNASLASPGSDQRLSREDMINVLTGIGNPIPEPEVFIEHSFPQKFLEAVVPGYLFPTVTYAIYAKKLDMMAHQRGTTSSLKRLLWGAPGFINLYAPGVTVQVIVNQLLQKEDDGPLKQFGIGIASGVAAAAFLTPAEFISVQQRFRRETFREATQSIYSRKGALGFLRGYTPTAGRDIISSIGFFFVPPLIEKLLPDSMEDNFFGQVAVLSIGGAMAGYLSVPFDGVRTLMQRTPIQVSLSIPQAFQELYRDGKWRGVFRGGGMRALRIAFAANIMVGVATLVEKANTRYNNLKADRLKLNRPKVGGVMNKIKSQRHQLMQQRIAAARKKVAQRKSKDKALRQHQRSHQL